MREVAKVKEERFDWLYIEGNRLPVLLALFWIQVLLHARINSTPGLWATRSQYRALRPCHERKPRYEAGVGRSNVLSMLNTRHNDDGG